MLKTNGFPGLYVVFEGGIGAGKTVQLARTLARIKQEFPELTFVAGREPGTTPVAEELRPTLKNKDLNPELKVALFFAVRVETMLVFIIPHMDEGHGVLMDRSFISSLANQGEGEGLGFDHVWSINQSNVVKCWPDAVILLHRETDKAVDSSTTTTDSDHWDKKGLPYHERVKIGYMKSAALLKRLSPKTQFIVVDGTGKEEEQVFDEVWFRFGHLFDEWRQDLRQSVEGQSRSAPERR